MKEADKNIQIKWDDIIKASVKDNPKPKPKVKPKKKAEKKK